MTKEEAKARNKKQIEADNQKQVDKMNQDLEDERRKSNRDQLLITLETAIDQARTVNVMYDELIRFAGAGYFDDLFQTTSLLRQHQMNNLTNVLVLENLQAEVRQNKINS